MDIAYFGPEGTFTEQAAGRFAGSLGTQGLSLSPLATIEDVFEAVGSGKAAYGVVPIENSTEGAVNTTLDTLIFDAGLFILKQLSLPIVQNMMTGKDNAEGMIKKIVSHPQALAQCRKFLNRNYPGVTVEAANSTAEAARKAARSGPEEGIAAIGSKNSAEIYGLRIIHDNIQDNKDNTTQFILLTGTDTSAPKAGCRTSVVFSTEHRPGELYKILDIFAIWGLNMTKIISRPVKNRRGEYVFFIEIESDNITDVADALAMVERKAIFFKNLGSYPSIEF
jgi:prephenate dehydratase